MQGKTAHWPKFKMPALSKKAKRAPAADALYQSGIQRQHHKKTARQRV
jgi:hypothetical protein